MTKRVLVTPRSLTAEPHPRVEALRDHGFDVVYSTPGHLPDEDELIQVVPGCTAWLAGVEPISERVIEAADALQIISRNGTGIDNLPMAAIERRGIAVAIAAGANATGVAELTIGLILAALRSIPAADLGIKQGGWPRRRGREITERTIGILGCGAIGRRVAQMIIGIGGRVVAHDPAPPDIDLAADRFRMEPVDRVLEEADIVSLHCPPLPGGKPVIDRHALARMRDGAILVNTARAALVDEAALLDALNDGRVFAYATDVFAEEPPGDLTLAKHERVIATSHIGALTEESIDRATQSAVDNILRHFDGDTARE